MCIICVEFNKKRITKDEVHKALVEMVMFAKTEEDLHHYKKLQSLHEGQDEKELEDFTAHHAKNEGSRKKSV